MIETQVFFQNLFEVCKFKTTTIDKGFFASGVGRDEYFVILQYKQAEDVDLDKDQENIYTQLSQIASQLDITSELEKIKHNTSLIFLVNDEAEKIDFKFTNTIEENQSFFKKYVFRYTEQEYSSILNQIKDGEDTLDTLQRIINNKEHFSFYKKHAVNIEYESYQYYNFVVRLFIKLPFLTVKIEPKENTENLMNLIYGKLNESQRSLHDNLIKVEILNDINLDSYEWEEILSNLGDE